MYYKTSYAVDTVTAEDKQMMGKVLRRMDKASVDKIVDQDDTPFENKQEVVSVLHSLLHEGEVTHNVSREYYLTA